MMNVYECPFCSFQECAQKKITNRTDGNRCRISTTKINEIGLFIFLNTFLYIYKNLYSVRTGKILFPYIINISLLFLRNFLNSAF